MPREVLVDTARILTEINKGNQTVANTLSKMRADGVILYYDEQGFREAVTNNPIQIEGQANRQTLQDLGFRAAPLGKEITLKRYEFEALNSAPGKQAVIQDGAAFRPPPPGAPPGTPPRLEETTNIVGNQRDAAIGATAYANEYEIYSTDATFARPGREKQLQESFRRVILTKKENEAETGTSATRRGIGLKIAPESARDFGSKASNQSTDANLGRKLLGLPRFTMAGRGTVSFIDTATPGFNPDATNAKMMAGLMALGFIISWLDDYNIEEGMKKDLESMEGYIRSRQNKDPATGFLLVAIIKRFKPADAAFASRSYISLEKFEAETLFAAQRQARLTLLPGLPPPESNMVSYEFPQMWIRPLHPKRVIPKEESDAKAYGAEFWYPTFKRLQQSLETPPDYSEALKVLVGCWLLAMIRVLDHLRSYNLQWFEDLKGQLRHLREPINRARVGLAMRAVEDHVSESSFGMQSFLGDSQTKAYYDTLQPDQRKEIADWVETGVGAMKHTIQGQWEVIMAGKSYTYSFRTSGTVIYRNAGSGNIDGEGTWNMAEDGVHVRWTKTGSVEFFPAPLKTVGQTAKSKTKGGTFDMTARKTNPYP